MCVDLCICTMQEKKINKMLAKVVKRFTKTKADTLPGQLSDYVGKDELGLAHLEEPSPQLNLNVDNDDDVRMPVCCTQCYAVVALLLLCCCPHLSTSTSAATHF